MLNYYIDLINHTIQKFIQNFNEEYDCCMELDFCAYLDTNTIAWSILCPDHSSQTFFENFVLRFPKVAGFDIFTLSILHELGHLETEDEMEDDTKERAKNLSDEEYYNLFNEKIATDWAGEWIMNHYEEALSLDNQFKTIFRDMYSNILNFTEK